MPHEDLDHNCSFIAIDFEETQLRSYKQIRADIAKLEREAAAVKKSESTAIVARIRKLAEQYGLTAADIGLDAAQGSQPAARPSAKAASTSAAAKKAAAKTPRGKKARSGSGVAKYRDPKSGKTWTGFGRTPGWLASAKNRDVFLIDADAGRAETAAAPRAASKAVKKGAAKTASRKAATAKALAGQPAAKKRAGAKTAVPRSTPGTSARSRTFARQPATFEDGAPARPAEESVPSS